MNIIINRSAGSKIKVNIYRRKEKKHITGMCIGRKLDLNISASMQASKIEKHFQKMGV